MALTALSVERVVAARGLGDGSGGQVGLVIEGVEEPGDGAVMSAFGRGATRGMSAGALVVLVAGVVVAAGVISWLVGVVFIVVSVVTVIVQVVIHDRFEGRKGPHHVSSILILLVIITTVSPSEFIHGRRSLLPGRPRFPIHVGDEGFQSAVGEGILGRVAPGIGSHGAVSREIELGGGDLDGVARLMGVLEDWHLIELLCGILYMLLCGIL